MTSVEGANSIGNDIELGHWNHCPFGTMFELDLVYEDTYVLHVGPSPGSGFAVTGIVANGINGGPGLVGTALDGQAPGILGRGSKTNPAVLGTNDVGIGVAGVNATNGEGVTGRSNTGTGVLGDADNGVGVMGRSNLDGT